MSPWGYLPSDIAVITAQEETPVRIRIQGSSATVKAFPNRWQQAYLKDDVRLVRRPTVLIALLVPLVPMARLGERWGLSASWLSDWPRALLWHGLDSLVSHQNGGRHPQWIPKQKQPVVELMEAGPLVGGWETACGPSGAYSGIRRCSQTRPIARHRGLQFTFFGYVWLWAAIADHGLNGE